jgi:RHS repeat-associated protein
MLVPPGASANTATWTPSVAQAGTYEVYARWTQHANRATNATYTVTHASGSSAVSVNQQQGGGAWNLLGTFSLSPGATHKISLTDQANGFVIADAIRLVPVNLVVEKKLYFIHVDHLNTPRLVADSTGATVWRWDQQEPFGNNPVDQNPSGLGVFDLPLRLPGQTYDAETGLHYNYYRDYDPSLGIYKQSDPIGLRGGINTYAYVGSDPLRRIDPTGLMTQSQKCFTGCMGVLGVACLNQLSATQVCWLCGILRSPPAVAACLGACVRNPTASCAALVTATCTGICAVVYVCTSD